MPQNASTLSEDDLAARRSAASAFLDEQLAAGSAASEFLDRQEQARAAASAFLDEQLAPESGVIGDTSLRIGRSLTRMPGEFVKSVGGSVDAIERTPFSPFSGPGMVAIPQIQPARQASGPTFGNAIQDVGREMVERPQFLGVDVGYTKELGLAPDSRRDDTIIAQAADSVGSLAASMATPGGVVAKTLTGMILQSQGQADQAREAMLRAGKSEDEANEMAAAHFVSNLPAGAIESLAWGKLMNRFGGKNILNAVDKKFGKNAAMRIAGAFGEQTLIEAGEEGIQQGWGNLINKATYKPEQDLLEGIPDAMAVGGLMGGVTGGGMQVVAEGLNQIVPPDTGEIKITGPTGVLSLPKKLADRLLSKTPEQAEATIREEMAKTEPGKARDKLADVLDEIEQFNEKQKAKIDKIKQAEKEANDKETKAKDLFKQGEEQAAIAAKDRTIAALPQLLQGQTPESQLTILDEARKKHAKHMTVEETAQYEQMRTALEQKIEADKLANKQAEELKKAQEKADQEAAQPPKSTQILQQGKPAPDAAILATDAAANSEGNPHALQQNLNNLTKPDEQAAPTPAPQDQPPPSPAASPLPQITQPPAPAQIEAAPEAAKPQGVSDADLLAIAEEIKTMPPAEALKFAEGLMVELDKQFTPEQKKQGEDLVKMLRKAAETPAKLPEVAPEPAKPLTDREQYDAIQAQIEALGPASVGTPEYQALWQASEDIKNRNDGMPPGETSPPVVLPKADAAKNRTETPAFKKWFGESKVSDSEGNPIVVYHGTNQWTHPGGTLGDFNIFERDKSKIMGGKPRFDAIGSWFSSTPEGASLYGKTLYPVYLSIKNPIRMTFAEFIKAGQKGDPNWTSKNLSKKGEIPTYMPKGAWNPEGLRKELKSKGYDGIIFPASEKLDGKEHEVYVALEPTQIKSAIGNSGKFDPSNPDIVDTPLDAVVTPPPAPAALPQVAALPEVAPEPPTMADQPVKVEGAKAVVDEDGNITFEKTEQTMPAKKAKAQLESKLDLMRKLMDCLGKK